MKSQILLTCLLSLSFLRAEPLTPKVAPPDPQWDRLYANGQILEMMRGFANAYPDWVKLESIGKTGFGGDTWLLTITNPKTGAAETKPAIYIDGATHANEVQGTEVCIYTIGYVLKNYGKLPRVTEFLDRSTLYAIPMMNYDSRDIWFNRPSTPNYPRTLPAHIDDDRDGEADEDGYDDLDGDGEITMMRKKVPLGQGNYVIDQNDPRILRPVAPGELGDYLMLGTEGLDNDGDGEVNEDLMGYVDPNRAWGEGWMPRYVQSGSSDYPLQYPEQRNIALWAPLPREHQCCHELPQFWPLDPSRPWRQAPTSDECHGCACP